MYKRDKLSLLCCIYAFLSQRTKRPLKFYLKNVRLPWTHSTPLNDDKDATDVNATDEDKTDEDARDEDAMDEDETDRRGFQKNW